MIKGYTLRVRRNESVTTEASYPAWERPILEAVHPETTVVRECEIDRPAPSAEEEYVRLENRYKNAVEEDGRKGQSFVAAIYGQHGLGIQRLQEAIDAAAVSDVSDLVGDAA